MLPGRAGELVRVLALSREAGLRRTAVLATVVVERVFDLAAIAGLELAVASRLPDADVTHRFTLLAAGILAATAVIVVVLAITPVRRFAGQLARAHPDAAGARRRA